MPRPDQDPQQAAEDLPSPDPSTGPGEVPTDQGPTLYAQGAEDPAGVGQADQPVVLSESNQGGNHPETGGGSANLTYGDKGQDADPAGTHTSSDDQAGKGKDIHGGMRQEANQAQGSTAATNPLNADQAGSDPVEAEQVCIHESGDLHAEDVEAEMAVLPEVTVGTADVKIEDIQVGDPEINSPEEIERLRGLIWKRRHLLIGKGNALPPAARGVVCDIDVGDARPIAQRVRKVAPQFREKLSDLIKGLLGAQIIKASISPWASPIVVIIKKNGVDIRLCIDYRLVNSLTRLMIYPTPLINDLLEDLDKVLWYCSLDMASGFWVVTMTDRARAISAFITPFGLFEWNRMPFGLKKAPQIYQRMLDNALYGFTRIPRSDKSGSGSEQIWPRSMVIWTHQVVFRLDQLELAWTEAKSTSPDRADLDLSDLELELFDLVCAIVKTEKRVVNVRFSYKQRVFVEHFIVLDLDDKFDVVMGMPWLARHDPVIDWKKRTLVRFGRDSETESDGPVTAARAPAAGLHDEALCDQAGLDIARSQTGSAGEGHITVQPGCTKENAVKPGLIPRARGQGPPANDCPRPGLDKKNNCAEPGSAQQEKRRKRKTLRKSRSGTETQQEQSAGQTAAVTPNVKTLSVLTRTDTGFQYRDTELASPPTTASELTSLPAMSWKRFTRLARWTHRTSLRSFGQRKNGERSEELRQLFMGSTTESEDTLSAKTKRERFEEQGWDSLKSSPYYELLREYKDVLPEDIPAELPQDKGIQHEIDLVPGTKVLCHAAVATAASK
ncbi:reverse transcriptase [Phytophthora cinnamomi]|uniref:reverse transcriptase n=1 Tax=Phytophthora cinnamomi TaxID=4785 RepID=UPI00355A6B1C|nr:reverse transcriptase [Phytophthora cinnamomi]